MIQIEILDTPGAIGVVGETLGTMGINIKNIKMSRESSDLMVCYLWLDLPLNITITNVLGSLQKLNIVQKVEID